MTIKVTALGDKELKEVEYPEKSEYFLAVPEDQSFVHFGQTCCDGCLSTIHDLTLFETEEELEAAIDAVMGEGYYESMTNEEEAE